MTLPLRKRGSGGGLGAKGTGPGPRAEGEAVGARVAEPDRRVAEPDRRVAEPDRRVAEPDRRVAEPDRRVAEPDRRVAEPDRRVAEPDCFLPGLRPPLGSCDYPRPNAGLGSSQQNKVNITDERARYFQLRFMRQSQNRLTGGVYQPPDPASLAARRACRRSRVYSIFSKPAINSSRPRALETACLLLKAASAQAAAWERQGPPALSAALTPRRPAPPLDTMPRMAT
ncbi:unnamed protein product [Rangifer tarandus platyrhynchus]|uniref:Uncharacterized protein n=1 Tax=Rangifer tarandus platyrhynchus TaxID=3082113 RepID=A0ABN8ZZ48_RANTA|nr:unnamed protein product [Rangifer tarandus platyrhynchus]